MSSKERTRLALAVAVLGLSSLFCIPTPTPYVPRIDDPEKLASQIAEDSTRVVATATGEAMAEATYVAVQTVVAGLTDEEIEATWEAEQGEDSEYPIEICIAKEDAYSLEYTDFETETGTGGTQCRYRFVVRNTSDEDQHLILYEKFDNNAMQWEDWKVRRLSAGDFYEYHYSYTTYSDGGVTLNYATKVLLVRGIQQCYWLTVVHQDIVENR